MVLATIKKPAATHCRHGKPRGPNSCRECGNVYCEHAKYRQHCAECQNCVCPVPECEGRRFSGKRGLQDHIDYWHSNKCPHKPDEHGNYGSWCSTCPECQHRPRHPCAVPRPAPPTGSILRSTTR